MERTNLKYRLSHYSSKRSNKDWDRYDFVFFASYPDKFNSEEFAKIEVTLQICRHNIRLNSRLTLLWYTVLDENGNKLKKPGLGWSYSDGFDVPKSSGFPEKLGDAKFAEFVENLIDTALCNWVHFSEPLQKSFDGALATKYPQLEKISARRNKTNNIPA